ncbi:MAG: hypothetical protein V1758_02955 [Pseudomonadota bacterium]
MMRDIEAVVMGFAALNPSYRKNDEGDRTHQIKMVKCVGWVERSETHQTGIID